LVRPITVTESIIIARPPAIVWDYTQDYGRRTDWDDNVLTAEVLSEDPRRVALTLRGSVSVVAEHGLFRHPARTSLAFHDVRSSWLAGGGGSWDYDAVPEGTRWTQTNSLVLKRSWKRFLIGGPIRRQLLQATRESMAEAKRILEEDAG